MGFTRGFITVVRHGGSSLGFRYLVGDFGPWFVVRVRVLRWFSGRPRKLAR